MTLLFFLYFFRFGHKIYSKVSTKVSSNQSKQFQSKNWYTFLRRKVKNSLSHKINISSSVVSVDISSPMDNSDSTALLQSFWSQWLVWQLNSSSCPDDKQYIQRQRLNSHNSSIYGQKHGIKVIKVTIVYEFSWLPVQQFNPLTPRSD